MLRVVHAKSRHQSLLHIVVSQQWAPSSYRTYAEGCRRSPQSLYTSLAWHCLSRSDRALQLRLHRSGYLVACSPACTCGNMGAAVALHHVPAKNIAAIHADHQLRPSKGICAFVCDIQGEVPNQRLSCKQAGAAGQLLVQQHLCKARPEIAVLLLDVPISASQFSAALRCIIHGTADSLASQSEGVAASISCSKSCLWRQR